MSSRTDLGVAPGSSSSCTRTSKIVSDEHSVILMDERIKKKKPWRKRNTTQRKVARETGKARADACAWG